MEVLRFKDVKMKIRIESLMLELLPASKPFIPSLLVSFATLLLSFLSCFPSSYLVHSNQGIPSIRK